MVQLLAAVVETLDDLREFACLDSWEDTVGLSEVLGVDVDRDVNPLLLGLLLHFLTLINFNLNVPCYFVDFIGCSSEGVDFD